MANLKLSVIIPVRNGEKILTPCLDALRSQSYPSKQFEIIVIDDDSTDGTVALVEKIISDWEKQGTAPALQLIRQKWRGAGAARNNGVKNAAGEVVVFTDADCEPVLDWLTAISKPFDNPEVVVVAGGYLTRQQSTIARLAQAEFENRYQYVRKNDYIDVAFTHSAAIKTEAFNNIGGFDERMPNNADDLELSYRLAEAGHCIVFAPDALVYHLHPSTLSDYVYKKVGRGFWRGLVFKRYPKKFVRDSYTPPTLKIQILCVMTACICLFVAVLGVSWMAYISVFSLILMLATTLPFVWRLDGPFHLKLFAPIFLLIQAGAVGLGALIALLPRTIEDYEYGGKRV